MPTNYQKITREFCFSKSFIFYPRNDAESMFIQERLMDLGCRWNKSAPDDTSLRTSKELVWQGIVVIEGALYYKGYEDKTDYLRCYISQLDPNYELLSSPEQAFILEQFNRLAVRVDELTEEVQKLRADILASAPKKSTIIKKSKAS